MYSDLLVDNSLWLRLMDGGSLVYSDLLVDKSLWFWYDRLSSVDAVDELLWLVRVSPVYGAAEESPW